MALRTSDLLGAIPSGDFANLLSGGIQSGVAAAGTSLATATPVTGDVVVIGSGTGGVRLRNAASFPERQVIINQSGAAVSVYPYESTGVIGISVAGQAFTLGGSSHCAEFVSYQPSRVIVQNQKTSL